MGNDEWDQGRGPGESDGSREKNPRLNGWKIRFDAPPGEELSRLADSGDILSLFRAWEASQHSLSPHAPVDHGDADTEAGPERRENPRYAPEETKAWIGWWHGPRFIVIGINLVNLSKGGALIYLGERPPTGQPVWICLGAPHPLEYVQCRVLDACPHPGSLDYRVRVDFHIPCPLGFFLAAGHKAVTS